MPWNRRSGGGSSWQESNWDQEESWQREYPEYPIQESTWSASWAKQEDSYEAWTTSAEDVWSNWGKDNNGGSWGDRDDPWSSWNGGGTKSGQQWTKDQTSCEDQWSAGQSWNADPWSSQTQAEADPWSRYGGSKQAQAKEDAWTEDPWQKHDPWKAKDPWKDSWAQAEDPWTSQEDPWAAETKDYQRSSWGGDNSDKKWTTWNAIEAWGDKLVEVDWTTRPPIDIKKDFYSECANPLAENRSAEEVAAIRHSDDIEIIDGDSSVPHPICSFEETCFPDDLMDRLTEQHFQEPSPIQKQIWPLAMQGRDLVGIAETGSGKTVAYILPMIVHISYQALLEKGDGPVALIFAPTRELASQIKEQCDLYGLPRGIKTCTIVGGTPSRQQREWLEDKNDIVVATPGRFMNALGDGWVTLNRATYVVLDEADEMLKKEFYDQIKLILSQVRKERQVLMFSATWPEEVKCFAQEICTASDGMPPVVVRIGGSKLAACKFIEQHTVMVDGEDEKYEQLLEKLQSPETFKDDSKAIIFCRTRGGVQRLVDRLKEEHFLWNENNDFMVACLHGELQQHDRDYAMKRFRSGEVPCVVSTGVLARGHDIPKVRFVFNYDLPSAPEDYIHRIGRTGRAGAKGYAMSFVDRSSWKEMESSSLFLMDVLKATDQKVEPDLKDAVDSYQKTQVWNEEETGNENGWGAEDGAVEASPEAEWDWSDPAKQEAMQEWQQQNASWQQDTQDSPACSGEAYQNASAASWEVDAAATTAPATDPATDPATAPATAPATDLATTRKPPGLEEPAITICPEAVETAVEPAEPAGQQVSPEVVEVQVDALVLDTDDVAQSKAQQLEEGQPHHAGVEDWWGPSAPEDASREVPPECPVYRIDKDPVADHCNKDSLEEAVPQPTEQIPEAVVAACNA